LIGNKKEKDPLPDNADTRADGKEAFSHYCVACYGMDGQNTGVPFAGHISPPIPSLASNDVQSYTDGQLKWILDNGIWPSGMPGSKGTLSDDELWSIIRYIRHLPPAGSQGIPQMYTQ
jgi:mono/diheme cytochrome c family protein